MSRKSCKRQLNNEKGCLFNEKITKSAASFRKNKPNSPNVQMNASLLITMNYTIFASLTKVKNKPNQTQFKANSNPIPERVKMNINIYNTKVYNNKTASGSKQNKPNSNPIQTQSNPVLRFLKLLLSARSFERNLSNRTSISPGFRS